MKLVEPLLDRPPFFDGWETQNAGFQFRCGDCATLQQIGVLHIAEAAWSWRNQFEEPLRSEIAGCFQINLNNTSIASGMDAVVRVLCEKCSRCSFDFFWINEYRHSCYQDSLKAIAVP